MRLIDADALRITLKHEWLNNNIDIGKFLDIIQCLKLAPTIDAEPVRHGKWVIEPDATVMHCNSCGWAYEYYAGLEEEWNYCSHCGAKMDSVEDEELL